jgi:cyclic pyranopterin phosphate synthase
MPDGARGASDGLSLDELETVCRQAADLGISRFKITGGEPLMRDGCTAFTARLKEMDGIKSVTLTTNGIFLKKYARELYLSGVDGINISLDTLKSERYRQLTGADFLKTVLDGIAEMQKYPVPLKINTVLQSGFNEDELFDIIDLARGGVDVRFIELMPIGCGTDLKGVATDEVLKRIAEKYSFTYLTEKGNGPAFYIKIEGIKGRVGFIGAVSRRFCENCNRIRLTSDGVVKSCLCYEGGLSVKDAVKCNDKDKISEIIKMAVDNKPFAHSFDEPLKISEKKEMYKIGG